MKNTTRTPPILTLLLMAAPAISAQSVAATPVTHAVADSQPAVKEPYAFADFTWLNGNSRQKFSVLDTKAFTGEFRADINYIAQFNHPKDHTLVGTTEAGRTSEFQLQQLGIGGDFHYGHSR